MKSLFGADTLVREPLEAKTNPKKVNEIRSVIIGPFNVFMDALREIFDESAYARFLETHRMVSSPSAYGDFLRETEAVKERRPRCC